MCFPCCQHNHPVPVCLWRTHRFIHGTLFIWQESRSKGWTGLRELFPRRQELITPDNISPALMVWDLYLEEIEPDLGSLHLYAFLLSFKASWANFPGLNCSNSLPLADTISMAFSCLWFAFVNTLNYNREMSPNRANLLILQHFISNFSLIVFNRLLKNTTAVECGLSLNFNRGK